MGILDIFRKKEPAKQVQMRKYAAAGTGRLFSGGFGASRNSADAELQPALSLIRARSRDLARNNEYASRYFELIRNNVVGKNGFNMQSRAYTAQKKLDENANNQIEEAYKVWSKLGNPTICGRFTMVDFQKAVLSAVVQDGDVFLIEHRGNAHKHTISFEMLEADYLDENHNEKLSNGHQIRMGVELNEFKKPVAYHFLRVHPGDSQFSTMTKAQKYRRIPASKVIHVMKPTRLGMTRAEPWISPAIPALDQLGAYREAAIINARVGASTMGFFTSPAGDGYAPDAMNGDIPIMEVEPGTFKQLPTGVQVDKFESSYPSNEFDDFHKAVLKGIASALNVSYAALSGDLSDTSFSSVRQGALDERDNYGNLQTWFIDHFARPVFERWLSACMEFGIINLPLSKFEHFAGSVEFRGRSWSWVDPQKEINAAITGLKNGVLSLSDVASQYGKSVDELLKQIDRDRQLANEYDIKFAFEPFGGNMEKVAPEIADE